MGVYTMASKTKISLEYKDNSVIVNGIEYSAEMYPQTRPMIMVVNNQLTAAGLSRDEVDKCLGVVFAQLYADETKGSAFVTAAIEGASATAKAIKAKAKAVSNKAALDEYNAVNRDALTALASEYEAAMAQLETVKGKLTAVQQDVTGKLSVDWSLDAQLLTHDDG
jgi:hypothetical protein